MQTKSNTNKVHPILYELSLGVTLFDDGQMTTLYENTWCKVTKYRLRISQTHSYLPTSHYNDSKSRSLTDDPTRHNYFFFDVNFAANGIMSVVPGT